MTTIERFGLSWSALKAIKSSLGVKIYEGSGFTYRVWIIVNESIFECIISSPADRTDYENNYRSTSIIVESGDIAYIIYAQNNSLSPAYTTEEYINSYVEFTTSSVTANQTIFTYTVPTGKRFCLVGYYIVQTTTQQNSVGAIPARWLKNGTVFDKASINGNQSMSPVTSWNRTFSYSIPFAVAGDVITATVTPSASYSTVWASRLIGRLFPT